MRIFPTGSIARQHPAGSRNQLPALAIIPDVLTSVVILDSSVAGTVPEVRRMRYC